MNVDKGIQSEDDYEYQRVKNEYEKGADRDDPLVQMV